MLGIDLKKKNKKNMYEKMNEREREGQEQKKRNKNPEL